MNTIVLKGLDGGNPLHFLAALGVLRILSLEDEDARLAWTDDYPYTPIMQSRLTIEDGHRVALCHLGARGCVALRTRLNRLRGGTGKKTKEQIKRIESLLKARLPSALKRAHPFASQADCIQQVERSVFRELADAGRQGLWAALLPGLAADGDREYKKGEWGLSRTRFSFSNGGSGKAILKDWRSSLALLRRAEPFDLGLLGFSLEQEETTGLMWDPVEQREYALRWGDPSKEDTSSTPVLNVFAFIGLSCLPVLPCVGSDKTTGLHDGERTFVWPIWAAPLNVDCISALVAMGGLASHDEASSFAMGIRARFASSIISANKRNFFAVARPGNPG